MHNQLRRKMAVVVLLGMLLSACNTSRDVATSGLLQKRKYRKGFHLERFAQRSSAARPEQSARLPETADEPVHRHASSLPPQRMEREGLHSGSDKGVLAGQELMKAAEKQTTRQVRVPVSDGNTTPGEPLMADRDELRPVSRLSPTKRPLVQRLLAPDYYQSGLLSLVAGIANFLFLWMVPVFGIAAGAVAIAYGIRALKSDERDSRIFGMIGLLLGIASILMSLAAHAYYGLIIFAIMAP